MGATRVGVGADIQVLVDAAPAGATFWIEAGVHRLQAVTPKDNQKFYGEAGAILNGSRLLTNFTKQGAYWVAHGQTQEGERLATDKGEDGADRPGYPDAFFIDSKPLIPVDTLSKVGPGKFYFDYAADKIYFSDNPAGRLVEAAVTPQAFTGLANGVTVQNLTIEKHSNPAQISAIQGGKKWIISDNEIRLNYGVGAEAKDGSQITGNFVHDNGQLGLNGTGHNLRVEGNEIAMNGWWSGLDVFWEGGGTKFVYTDGLIVRGNHSHDNKGFGLWTDIDNIRTLYEDNIVERNSGGGIAHEISYDAIIKTNTILNNGYEPQGENWLWGGGIQIQNSKNVEVYCNKVVATGDGNGIVIIQQERGTGSLGDYLATGNDIHNNLVVAKTPGRGASGTVADWNEISLIHGRNVFHDNRYYVGDLSSDYWSWGSKGYNWDTYREISGQDRDSIALSSIADDIIFGTRCILDF